jgi:hypothetical protein
MTDYFAGEVLSGERNFREDKIYSLNREWNGDVMGKKIR